MATRTDQRNRVVRWPLTVVLALLFFIYVASTFGVVSGNDGSNFAAARALVEYGSFEIHDGEVFAINDVAVHEGLRYSNKPPGTAVLATPFYFLSKIVAGMQPREVRPEESQWYLIQSRFAHHLGYNVPQYEFWEKYVGTRWEQDCTTLMAPLAGILGLWMIYRICLRLGASTSAAMLTMVAIGLGTLYWRYSTTIFSHVVSAALLLTVLEWLISGRAYASRVRSLVWGLLLGLNVAVEYQAVLSVPVLLIAWLATNRRSVPGTRDTSRHESVVRFAAVLAGGAVVAVGLAWYHTACFGSPWRTSVAASEFFAYSETVSGQLGGGFWDGARVLLFSAEKQHGLLFVSPVAVLALLGWFCWPRKQRVALLTCGGIVLVHCVVIFNVVSPDGGATMDHRYIVRIIPVLMLPLAFAVDRWIQLCRSKRRWPMLVGAAVFAGLLLVSGLRSYGMTAGFLKHAVLQPGFGKEEATSWAEPWAFELEDRSGFEAAFPSWNNLSLLILAAGVYVVVIFAATGWRRPSRMQAPNISRHKP